MDLSLCSCHVFQPKRQGNCAAQQLQQLFLDCFRHSSLSYLQWVKSGFMSAVGATLGALNGAYVGAKTKIGYLHGATVEAIKGSFFSIKFFKISLIVCSSDDVATRYLLQPVRLPPSLWRFQVFFLLSAGSAHALRFFGPLEIHVPKFLMHKTFFPFLTLFKVGNWSP
ncbi:hypothetical protein QQP08_023335 [Theobroma cacao]|nr:hypothetical protein QQP08_023335 [Theobroma cacao]